MNDKPDQPQVFIVDDEPVIVDFIIDFIRAERLPVKAVPCHSAKEAMDKLTSATRGIVLSDIAMPGMSGLDLLREMNAHGVSMPVIFLTGYGNREFILEAWRLGAFDFLEKPVEEGHLIEAVKIALTMGQEFIRHRRLRMTAGARPNERTVGIHFSAEQYERIRAQAEAMGMDPEEWCAQAILGLAG